MRLNLCCSDQFLEGFIGVDLWTPPWATDENFIKADLRHSWPFADGSIEHVRAHDAIEHMPDKIHTMNELHRVLKPGGTVEIVVPTTDGPGAWQDPTHCSYWNRNSFLYHTAGDPHYNRFHEAYGIKGAFNVKASGGITKDSYGVTKLQIVLEAVKESVGDFGPFVQTGRSVTAQLPVGINQPRKFAFSILHTSARPDKWREIYDAWIGAAAHPEQVEYCLCIDERWGFSHYEWQVPAREALGLRPQDKVIWNTGRKCYVDGVNLAAEASTGDVLIVNADDQWPCDMWDEKLHRAYYDGTTKPGLNDHIQYTGRMPRHSEWVWEVTTNTPTEHERGIMPMPILSRERYERFGWVFFPSYESMYADNDFCAMARRDGVVIDARHLVFPHVHPINTPGLPMDEAYQAQNRGGAYFDGERIFSARQAINFAGVPPAQDTQANMPVVSGLIQGKRRVIATCTPGETFSGPWKNSWDWLFANLVNKYDVIPINGYTSDVTMTRMVFAKAVIEAEPKPEFVLWLDDDNMLTFEQFEMLMADLDTHPELDAVVGWCWIMRHDIALTEAGASISCGQLLDVELTTDGAFKFCRSRSYDYVKLMEGSEDIRPIGYSGFPVVLMRAELVKKAGGPDAFLPVLDTRFQFGKSGEDISFFARAGIRGGRFAVDRRIEVPHLKLMPAGPSQQVLDKYKQEAVSVK